MDVAQELKTKCISGDGKSRTSERHRCEHPPGFPPSSGTGEKVQQPLCGRQRAPLLFLLCVDDEQEAEEAFLLMNDLELSARLSFIMQFWSEGRQPDTAVKLEPHERMRLR